MYQSSRPPQSTSAFSVPPKRLLAQRLLRSVAARQSVTVAPSSASSSVSCPVQRFVGVRTSAPGSGGPMRQQNDLPRVFASRMEGPRNVLIKAFRNLQRAARANLFSRLAGRFAPHSQRLVAFELVASKPVASKLRPH